jgi:hypothetical protein
MRNGVAWGRRVLFYVVRHTRNAGTDKAFHPISFHGLTGEPRAHKDPVELMTDEKFNMHVGLLLQALETDCFRSTVKSR